MLPITLAVNSESASKIGLGRPVAAPLLQTLDANHN
jgi:hypothetical protein